jgi:hypothetical protein
VVTAQAGEVTRTSAPRIILLTGIAAGTAIVVTAYWDGLHPRIPGISPPVLGSIAAAITMWLLLVGLAAVVAELLRRHHRSMASAGWKHTKRAGVATGRAAIRGGGATYRYTRRRGAPLWQRLTRWAGHRWCDRTGVPAEAADHPPGAPASGDTSPNGDDAMTTRDITPEHPTTPHNDWFTFPEPKGDGDQPRGRTRTAAPRVAPTVSAPANWKALAAAAGDFEPEDDSELLAWMASQVAGLSTYADAVISVYETCVDSIGLDPVAMSATHDVADAIAEAAVAVGYARQRFASHYSEVREFAANGGVLPHDGRWITGEGDA